VALVATRGAGAAYGWFGFALSTAATFDVFHRFQVTNYGLLYIPFDLAPGGSDCIDVWDLLHAQTAPQLFRATFLATSPGESKLKSCLRAQKTHFEFELTRESGPVENWAKRLVSKPSILETTAVIRRERPRAIYLQARSLSLAQMGQGHRATQSLGR